MKPIKQNLAKQLLCIAIIILGIIFIALGLFLPKLLLPIYENNIYQYLKQPLELIDTDISDSELQNSIAYIYVNNNKEIMVSSNLKKIINIPAEQILDEIDNTHGKFKKNGRTYYYNSSNSKYSTKIALTNNDYFLSLKKDILYIIFPIFLITFILITAIILWWSERLVKKIEHLKEKVDNLDNDKYIDDYEYTTDDELNTLSLAIDKMHLTLKEQEEYKNQMYQNISHDFKTPITVIRSYMEAIEDGVETVDNGSKVIKEQVIKLEQKVHSLLYLNKLNYIKDNDHFNQGEIDIADIIKLSIDKFKIQRPDVDFELVLVKNIKFRGTNDMWEAIVDNMLNNFVRYADRKIKISVKNNVIVFYNDGANIDPSVLDDIFTPYKKGIKGQFGLGLSIIKKTLSVCNYEIKVKNEKKGISFIIKNLGK